MQVKWIAPTAAILMLLLSGCRVHETGPQLSKTVTLKNQFDGEGGTGVLPEKWWTAYADPTLDALINESLENNLDLAQAWSRLAQVAAIAEQANAAILPTVDGNLRAGRSRSPSLFGDNQDSNQFSASLSVGYEVDVWGKIRDGRDAAKKDVEATRMEIDALALTLTAQVAEAYFDFQESAEQLKLLHEQVATSEQFLKLVEFRFAQGDAAAVDVLQQRQSLASVESRLPASEAALKLAANRLAILRGQTPGPVPQGFTGTLPNAPTLPATGVPANLLQRRPDLKAAEIRVLAADHRVGVAFANRLPSLRIGGEIGNQATSLDDLVSDFVWSIFGSVTGNLFDNGRLSAEIDRSKAALQQGVESYHATLLTCVKEVEDALVQNQHQQATREALERQLSLAQSTLTEAKRRYLNGLSSYLPVLQALQSMQEIQRQVVRSQRTELSYRNYLFKALGGTWHSQRKAPEIQDQTSGENSAS